VVSASIPGCRPLGGLENDNGHLDHHREEGLGGRVAGRTDSAVESSTIREAKTGTERNNGRRCSLRVSHRLGVALCHGANFMSPEEAANLVHRRGRPPPARPRQQRQGQHGTRSARPRGFKLTVENLPNGDEVACSNPWKPPDPFQGVSTADMQ